MVNEVKTLRLLICQLKKAAYVIHNISSLNKLSDIGITLKFGRHITLQFVLGFRTIIAMKLSHGPAYPAISAVFRWLSHQQLLSGRDLDRL